MNKIKELREFLSKCPALENIPKEKISIDWTDDQPVNYGIFPTGESIINRTQTICGDVIYTKQYNVVVYARNFTANDVMRLENCDMLENLQEWLEEQQSIGTVPQFGDDEFEDDEYITAQNGILFEMSQNGDSALYQIQISKIYKKRKENKDNG